MNYLSLLKSCVLCPHKCKVNRTAGKRGFCGASADILISSALPHYGEEPPISGSRGSGTIFFGHCNMKCVYCQNFQISQEFKENSFRVLTIPELADIMTELQNLGCHNVNYVSPTIWIPQIIESLKIARKEKNLTIPAVFNSGGYENPGIIKMLKGFIEIYMPDIRYNNDDNAYKYSGVKNYTENNKKSLIEMYGQVGGLKTDKNGIALKGLIVRLLIMPNNIASVKESLDFIKNELSTDVYISIMAQYHPLYKAHGFSGLNRRINHNEYIKIINYAEKLGFCNGAFQDYEETETAEDLFIPDFHNEKVFRYKKKDH
ncbi:MAG: radical SAM protein [Actinobacteria bacterium]|nr:radical SAM protein [Actinomycetota bacterium]